jgi:DNA polymerase
MLVGEQPGDEEDVRGHPFVGPAGRLLDQCLSVAALERNEIFITNAVKHFKWEPRGKRRLHKKPDLREIDACNVWLQMEISRGRPHVLVALGATALRALLGRTVTIDSARHQSLRHSSGIPVLASYHPSAILRADGEHAVHLRAALIEDLTRARNLGASDA